MEGESLVHPHPVRSPWASPIRAAGVWDLFPAYCTPPFLCTPKKTRAGSLLSPNTPRGFAVLSLSREGVPMARGPFGTGALAVFPPS